MIKCDPRARAKCELKKACCGDEVAYFVEGSLCDAFNQRVLSERPMTNADRIRAMSDEELGAFLGEWASDPKFWKCDGTGECLHWLQLPCEGGAEG